MFTFPVILYTTPSQYHIFPCILYRSVKEKLEEAAAKVAEISELSGEIEDSHDVTLIVKKLQGDVLGLREQIKVDFL